MFTRITFALAIILGTATAILAATKQHSFVSDHDVYDTRGAYVGSDPDVRFELRPDWERDQQ